MSYRNWSRMFQAFTGGGLNKSDIITIDLFKRVDQNAIEVRLYKDILVFILSVF